MAYTGIAACNIGGRTLSSILSLDARRQSQPLSTTALIKLGKELQIDTLSLIIIDEISNISASTLAAIHSRLTGNSHKGVLVEL